MRDGVEEAHAIGEREAEFRRPMSRGMAIPGGGDFRNDALEGVLRRHAE